MPTETAVVYTNLLEAQEAGYDLGEQIRVELNGKNPHALILFISPRYDALTLTKAISGACQPELLVGCSSAGEFTSHSQGEGQACAIALWSTDLKFAAGMGRGISRDRAAAAEA